ncbi:hypothetical protein IAQ61_009992 [Plenodomus lingam]|uniref:DUF7907 domain-containing protein n=1 Tax=Leptosphaeria maculans (strain JN3 / isolate v23.1.3 / race Av1-4-5-6-7-8) TaxID=985895 RepID=E5AEY8_LEPMJ|nr:hypothetical protein LEMA_P005640.1 [Plenodomus lingam JN3]KAH9862575.1 hypothetical protein IAQ61_009992 [Plenodomus lingam]CBY01777.1 hypothetical protein LEMA_P005640.1 [Plenodomus lingam JN3]
MKTTPLALSLLATTLATAQSTEPFYNITSTPFNLVVTSADGTINTTLAACHVGAALESLCLSANVSPPNPGSSSPSVFNFNTSTYSQAPEPTLGTPGILTWILQAASMNVSSSAYFNYDPTTDIALPILEPGSARPQIVAFDLQNRLTLQGSVDYTVQPPQPGVYREFYRWYACETYFASYRYVNLAWKLGPGEPENQSCVAVNVTRIFVA